MCFECLLAKDPRGKRPGLLHSIPLGQRPFGTVHMDHVGPFITTAEGNKYILARVDNFTRFIVLYAVCLQELSLCCHVSKILLRDTGCRDVS